MFLIVIMFVYVNPEKCTRAIIFGENRMYQYRQAPFTCQDFLNETPFARHSKIASYIASFSFPSLYLHLFLLVFLWILLRKISFCQTLWCFLSSGNWTGQGIFTSNLRKLSVPINTLWAKNRFMWYFWNGLQYNACEEEEAENLLK